MSYIHLSLKKLFSLTCLENCQNAYRFNEFGKCPPSCLVNFSPGVLAFFISWNPLEQGWLWGAAILRVTSKVWSWGICPSTHTDQWTTMQEVKQVFSSSEALGNPGPLCRPQPLNTPMAHQTKDSHLLPRQVPVSRTQHGTSVLPCLMGTHQMRGQPWHPYLSRLLRWWLFSCLFDKHLGAQGAFINDQLLGR